MAVAYQNFPYHFYARYVDQSGLHESGDCEGIHSLKYLGLIQDRILFARDAFDRVFLRGAVGPFEDPDGQLSQCGYQLCEGLVIEKQRAREEGVERVLEDLEVPGHHRVCQ